ncbi:MULTISPECIES: ribulose-phosphate 3-epimerase [unclassified Gilliamella]|uniref:ribulose-phosphate 3-epimerase n=1 Tax=unclassified Gilliamella TaxID=2685620 RepID=UPI00226A7668|nr:MULTISPECIES: ribulose-phosphate 3-epimerase [unclassified Gilliamella]MCX8583934.1 ribulose-phosphate 3-epimerase [Gilliamella sp. B3372]MCX8594601.1 ribulose-phosphate 3-epimerase [Gilliamella sp. B3367]
MSNKLKLSPSVFAADLGMLKQQIAELETNQVDLLHVDVMDGHFVERIAFGADHIKALKKMTHLPLDVHLMVQNPEVHLDSIIAAGADIITIHQEATNRHVSCLNKIRKAGIKSGIVLNPGTSEENIRYLLDDIDMILLMTVNPGEGGQHFLMSVVEKIKRVKAMIDNRNIDIEVDGSIDDKTIKYCHAAGANVFVSGGYLFNGNITDNITKLKAALAE